MLRSDLFESTVWHRGCRGRWERPSQGGPIPGCPTCPRRTPPPPAHGTSRCARTAAARWAERGGVHRDRAALGRRAGSGPRPLAQRLADNVLPAPSPLVGSSKAAAKQGLGEGIDGSGRSHRALPSVGASTPAIARGRRTGWLGLRPKPVTTGPSPPRDERQSWGPLAGSLA